MWISTRVVTRIAHVRRLTIFMEKLKSQGLPLLPGVFKYVQHGRNDLIQASLTQVQSLAEYLKNELGEEGYNCIIHDITPFLTDLVDHEASDIRDMARGKLGDIAQLMTEADRSNYVLKVCLELVQEQQRDQNKIAGLKLLGQLAGLFQKEFVQGFVVTQLTALIHDPSDNVRVMTVEQMAKVCSFIDDLVVLNKFAPKFKILSQDPNWQVRLNFVKKLEVLSEHLPLNQRNKVFGELYMTLLNDKTRWVKEAALQHLGNFLSQLDINNKNDKLFEVYLSIPKLIAKFNKEPQNNICFAVAETLPKIIQAQGENSWKSLSVLYKTLLKQDEEVRIILAKNVHLLSKCLVKNEYKNELLSVMRQNFLSSTAGEKLRQEALKNLASFLEMLDQDKREDLADIYSQLQQGNRKWRIREIIASQISILSRLFLEETIVKIIIPISFQLCKDDVACVRETACLQIASLLANNKGRALCELLIIENVKSFASYNRFTHRQSFAMMCDGLLEDWATFKTNFLSLFEKLAQDKVVNVRIAIAKVLVSHMDKKSIASKEPQIQAIYNTLAKDKNSDIVKIVKKEHTMIEEVVTSLSGSEHNTSRRSEEEQMEEVHQGQGVQETANLLATLDHIVHEAKEHPPQKPLEKEETVPEVPDIPVELKAVEKELEKAVETHMVEEITPEVKEAIEESIIDKQIVEVHVKHELERRASLHEEDEKKKAEEEKTFEKVETTQKTESPKKDEDSEKQTDSITVETSADNPSEPKEDKSEEMKKEDNFEI